MCLKREISLSKFEVYRKSQETQSLTKRSSSQRNLSLSPTQRLDNLIQASTNDLLVEGKNEQGVSFVEPSKFA